MSYHQIPPQAQYCHPYFPRQYLYENTEFLEEPESFIDAVSYSESDGYIDIPMVRAVPSHDIQELYVRKPIMTSSQTLSTAPQRSVCCFGGNCAVPEYVYDLKPRPPPHLQVARALVAAKGVPRRASSAYARTNGCLSSNKTADESTTLQENNCVDSSSFRSTPMVFMKADANESSPLGTQVPIGKSTETKRYPVTYRTSRYMRRPVAPALLKKLSTASEPFSHQPAVTDHKRLLRPQIPPGASKSQEIKLSCETKPETFKCRTHPDCLNGFVEISVKKMNSEGDATSYNPDINQLDTIERIAATLDENEIDNLSVEHKNEIKELSKVLVPRVPSSVKAMQQKQDKKDEDASVYSERNDFKDDINSNTGEMTPLSLKKSLNNILDELESCELSFNAVKSKYAFNQEQSQATGKKVSIKENENGEGIFNLREISEKMSKSYSESMVETTTEAKNLDKPRKILSTTPRIFFEENYSSLGSNADSKGSIDDTTALELHRSKSYIVNLIDRALSKELGTIPTERCGKDQFQDLTPTKAINHISRNCKMNNEFRGTVKKLSDQEIDCVTTIPESKESQSSLSNEGEPAYIRQLKELRWGHFKHIQQEVKRLEDLERFLDTCSTPCASTF